jgi:hypothetical protein
MGVRKSSIEKPRRAPSRVQRQSTTNTENEPQNSHPDLYLHISGEIPTGNASKHDLNSNATLVELLQTSRLAYEPGNNFPPLER